MTVNSGGRRGSWQFNTRRAWPASDSGDALDHAAVDTQDGAVDVTGAVAGQEGHRITVFTGGPVPPCRNSAEVSVLDLLDAAALLLGAEYIPVEGGLAA